MSTKLSERDRLKGIKEATRLHARIDQAEAEGRWRDARGLRRLFSRSYTIKLGMMLEEMARQNARQRPPAATRGTGHIDCNALQRQLTGDAWMEADLNRNEVMVGHFDGEELVGGDIIQIGSVASQRPRKRWKNKHARHKAAQLHLGHPAFDRYTLFAKRKASGGTRPIHAFGVADRVKQRLLLEAYGNRLNIGDNIFNARGKGGRPAAIAEVVNRINNGAKWAVVLDLKNFFGSINREWLMRSLPMPKAYIRSTILLEDVNEPEGRLMRNGMGTARTRARIVIDDQSAMADDIRHLQCSTYAGVPQGAATSAAIASHVISKALEVMELPQGVFLIVYADDMLLLGERKADVEQAMWNLTETFGSHPSGPYALHQSAPRRVCDGFEFLGMAFRSRRGEANCAPDAEAKTKAMHRILKAALEVVATGQPLPLERTMAGVLASFPAWRWRSNWLFHLLGQLWRRLPELRYSTTALYQRFRSTAQAELLLT